LGAALMVGMEGAAVVGDDDEAMDRIKYEQSHLREIFDPCASLLVNSQSRGPVIAPSCNRRALFWKLRESKDKQCEVCFNARCACCCRALPE
jgi:hypothetical protein